MVALTGVGVLLVTGVLEWSDLLAERAAWDVFIWYGGLVRMASALGDSGITKRFAEAARSVETICSGCWVDPQPLRKSDTSSMPNSSDSSAHAIHGRHTSSSCENGRRFMCSRKTILNARISR